MSDPIIQNYTLVPRGGPGLACDDEGLALGSLVISWKITGAGGQRRYRILSLEDTIRALRLAYGPTRPGILERRCRGLARVTQLLGTNAGALARIHAVLIGFPEIEPEAMAKLAAATAFRKYNPDWEDEPRIPANEPGTGEWTNSDDADDANGAKTEISQDKCIARCADLALPTRDYGISFFRCLLACRSNGSSGFPEWDRFFR